MGGVYLHYSVVSVSLLVCGERDIQEYDIQECDLQECDIQEWVCVLVEPLCVTNIFGMIWVIWKTSGNR